MAKNEYMQFSENDKKDMIAFISSNIWAITSTGLEGLIARIQNDSKAGQVALNKIIPEDDLNSYGYKALNGVAVINMDGVITKKFSFINHFMGMISTQMLQQDIENALNDSSVKNIVLNIDSPGGTVDGTKELSDYIYNARNNAQGKKIIVYGNGAMLSGGYYIGSAGSELYSFNTSYIGSIGVYRPHVDISKALDNFGIRVTLIHAGKYKIVGNPFEKLSDADKEIMQKEVNDQYDIFVDTVARNRGLENKYVREEMAEGRLFIGKEAGNKKLIDGLGTLEEVISYASATGINGQVVFKTDKKTKSTKESLMNFFKKNEEAGQPVELTAENLQKNEPLIYQQIFDAGEKSGKEKSKDELKKAVDEAKAGEKARVTSVMELVEKNPAQLPKALELLKTDKAVGEIAVELLKEKNSQPKQEGQSQQFNAGAAEMINTQQAEAAAESSKDLASAWEKDENLRKSYTSRNKGRSDFIKHVDSWGKNENNIQAEFAGNFDSYLAYARNVK